MSRARIRDPFADPGYAPLKARIIARTGHHYYADKDDLLLDRLVRRYRACSVPDAAAYLVRLDDPSLGAAEWKALEAEITIGETFFFRYAEQFVALRNTILPGIVAGRSTERSLKVWSAGCSTGAEPYSVAILLREILGPALPGWHVGILGTDISAEALATARGAVFGRWALRTMPTEERLRYFRAVPGRDGATREGGYRLRSDYARMVRFERQNLLSLLEGGGPALGEFDLILCRNVLIYFDAATVTGIVRALGERLRPGGWLLIGHAEPNPSFASFLAAVSLPGTVAYRRPEDGAALPPVPAWPPASPAWAPEVPLPSWTLPLPMPEPPAVPEAESAAVPAALPPPEPVAEHREPPSLDRIRALADSGAAGEAWRALRLALSATPFDPALRFYEGLLARSLGRDAEAERALRGALYLDRDFVMAHYHLGLLLSALSRPEEARRALDNAAALAETLPPGALLPEGDGAAAADVARLARAGLGGRVAGAEP
ncbi:MULTISPECIES: CheR family methyltransferase [Methylobacterium]|uniref:protein-glutamate O-methyltransferase n=4 Tax=Pseudomonadota TaxID=1224 RepID=A0ABQ4STM3_9HYPH|nr:MULTISPECIES: CheR family methyltransferase [Methylobacterium]PIU05565.1 MAG: protein-glutamate methyltransferase [Methylobacterium sp. CG09_land_8_20_14_0_10_71_15]PIU14740.1 MAG: protein-glutamate methyltransferase [Methylobacterium sp. CG08_land_8_20_14_0_20_71_15]GBU18388.1 protein-glutamate O-methyltransferase [Methylobacterium sp.]GJE05803.1 hypothetical protein AOPFMNJM_1109 [Methylobacterium jeotgali]